MPCRRYAGADRGAFAIRQAGLGLAQGIGAGGAGAGARTFLPFRAVNREGLPGYDPGLQRHHLLPRQLLFRPEFARMLAIADVRFDDFRHNGLLLPCAEQAAIRLALPLHRGPHPRYTELVVERVAQIERGWTTGRGRDPATAIRQVRMRLTLLQRGLRRYLLEGSRRKLRLNRFDPGGHRSDFGDLDAMADALWGATA
ncbi:AHH domain-containing protein [Novosphingobium colocasiae]|uniref:Uncharacterized protein n=1 Tax=Novosphingobium colocasiae TaxID=1256513 RepID=A0A918UHV7_9SPHN|nr:AHH domain-containing protein [Novosphingobium colocasiae]GGZ10398.1 hypothetical protein GCM10011614_26620 [Novosphingobium colocasiae]